MVIAPSRQHVIEDRDTARRVEALAREHPLGAAARVRLWRRRTVRIVVRYVIALASLCGTLVLCGTVLCGTARADIAVNFLAQGIHYGDQAERNMGASVELSIDRDQWQYFTELGIAAASFGGDFVMGTTGTMFRGGLGMRYRARRYAVARMNFDLGFEAVAAMQDIEWGDGERDVRPELAGGFAWTFDFRKVAFRTSVRVFMTPTPKSDAACRGMCTHDEISSGFMLLTGLAW